MKRIALLLCLLAAPALADTVTVSWDPASEYTDGQPLPQDRSWTLIEQVPAPCATVPLGAPIDGVGRLILSATQSGTFSQPAGTCYCYVARTVVWSTATTTALTSAPVPIQKCTQTRGCSGCHR